MTFGCGRSAVSSSVCQPDALRPPGSRGAPFSFQSHLTCELGDGMNAPFRRHRRHRGLSCSGRRDFCCGSKTDVEWEGRYPPPTGHTHLRAYILPPCAPRRPRRFLGSAVSPSAPPVPGFGDRKYAHILGRVDWACPSDASASREKQIRLTAGSS